MDGWRPSNVGSLNATGRHNGARAKNGLHGTARLPSGEVAASFHATNLDADCGAVELLLRVSTRSEAVQLAKNLGLQRVLHSPPIDSGESA